MYKGIRLYRTICEVYTNMCKYLPSSKASRFIKKKKVKKKLEILNLGVVFKTTSSTSGSQIPQTQSLVPRSRKGVITVRRQNYITNEVRMSMQTFLRDTVVKIITCKVPDDQSFVYATRFNKSENVLCVYTTRVFFV